MSCLTLSFVLVFTLMVGVFYAFLVFCHLSMIFSVSIYVVVITTFGVLAFALVEAPFCVFTCLTW